MRIRSIEIQGFKSFADRTRIDLHEGITGIVGPNGCGKSNIVDAIRWALGESSAKRLRGENMEELLFNGTAARPSEGFSEVALTFVRENGASSIEEESPLSEFTEVEVTRRLHRSGEGEYLLNKVPCRLRDVRELFVDTGIGSRAYSIVEQGHISAIITAKPEDLRVYFEEAAAIGKFKWRRQEAEKKLEAAGQNLLRVQDILSEIQRQMRALDRQARKAERYKKLKAEQKEIDLSLVKENFEELQERLQARHGELSEVKEALQKFDAGLREKEAFLAQLRSRQGDFQNSVQSQQNLLFELHGEIQRLDQECAFLEKEMERLERVEEEDRGILANLGLEVERCKEEVERLQKELNDRVEKIDGRRQEVRILEQELEETEARFKEGEERLQHLSEGRFEVLAEQARCRNTQALLEKGLEELSQRRAGSEEERQKALLEKDRVNADLQKSEKRHSEALARCKEQEDQIRSMGEAEERLNEKLQRVSQQLEVKTQSKLELGSRLKSLRELEAEYTSYEDGVRTLMKERAQGVENVVRGIVADALEVPKQYELAVEAALGNRLQNMIVESEEQGVAAVEYLKSRGVGRGTFIPIQLKGIESSEYTKEERAEVIAPLMEAVQIRQEFAPVVQFLLKDAVVVKDLAVAHQLWKKNGHRQVLVTLEGDLVDPYGVVTGGRSEATSGILPRRREIRELEEELIAVSRDCQRLETDKQNLARELDQIRERLRQGVTTSTQGTIDRRGLEQEIEQLRREFQRFSEQLETLHLNLQRIVAGEEESQGQLEAARRSLAQATEQEGSIHQEAQSIKQGLEELRPHVEALQKKLTEKKVELASEEERTESLRKEFSLQVRNEHELLNRRSDIEARIQSYQKERERSHREHEEKARISELKKVEKEQKQKEFTQLQQEFTQIDSKIRALEEEIRASRQQRDGEKEKVHRWELEIVDWESKRDRMVEAMQQKYQTDLESYEIPNPETLSPRVEREQRLAELEQKLGELGEVSLGALEEYGELQRREEFLSKQKADLDQSILSLREAIRKMERTTRDRFHETYQAVNEQFKQLFPKLFRGGRAELVLTNPDNYAETGVDIIVQPPGKKLQNIQLLSGGEKALSALSLIFSFFLVKPSPFCLLDEVDAPLDDANIGRFTDMVREMTSRTQFLIITHNKKTMEIANTLYGVTMQQAGVSKLLSVNLV
ncbi:MAG: chromosome segregation protein SMC [Deltaproteobacteria bacterium]|nr:chromosome segregation protein SMC [Deltaproteobacteria bacterium]